MAYPGIQKTNLFSYSYMFCNSKKFILGFEAVNSPYKYSPKLLICPCSDRIVKKEAMVEIFRWGFK